MTDLVLSEEEEQAVEEGTAAQALLDSPSFIITIDRLRQQCAEAILTSDPHKGAEREASYNLSRGLSAITVELIALAARAETVLENAARQSAEPVQADTEDAQPGDY